MAPRKVQSPLEVARALLAANEAQLASAQTDAGKADAALAAARQDAEAAQHAFDAAGDAYSAEPTDASARAVSDARGALDLATLRLRKPAADSERAADAVRVAQRAVDAARAEVETLERAARVEALRSAAALPQLLDAIAPRWSRIFDLLEEVQREAAAIDSAFSASLDASEELRAMGEDVPEAQPLDPHVLLTPLLAHVLDVVPGNAGHLEHQVRHGLGWAFAASDNQRVSGIRSTVALALRVPLVADLLAPVSNQNASPAVIASLEMLAHHRTLREALARGEELRANLEAAAAAREPAKRIVWRRDEYGVEVGTPVDAESHEEAEQKADAFLSRMARAGRNFLRV